jgi:CheY-like chemotaxis protein
LLQQDVDSGRAPSKENAMSAARQSSPSLLVLFVDDNEEIRQGYSAYLQYVGMNVVTAVNGVEAVEKASQLLPDVIVMDMAMPELDGGEAAARLKERPNTRNIPVIAVSGYDRPPNQFRALVSGCDAFLKKPLVPRDLSRAIRAVANKRTAGALR